MTISHARFDQQHIQRPDYDIIINWVAPEARVLDLGCGSGELLQRLQAEKGTTGHGVDWDQASVTTCISKGLSVFHGDLHEGLSDLPDDSYDVVILSRTLQQVADPDAVIRQMLRIAPRAIVSFPNFAYWRIRLHLLLTGMLPTSNSLPYVWYDTPNIRVVTIADFDAFCREQEFRILERIGLVIGDGTHAQRIARWHDWRSELGIFLLGRKM